MDAAEITALLTEGTILDGPHWTEPVRVPADESFKLAQALGLDTESLWDRTGVLEKSGENVQATPVGKRTKVKNLGEPTADGSPASLIDVLHRMCAFREKSDTEGMAQFLGRSGHGNNHSLWLRRTEESLLRLSPPVFRR